MSSAGSVLRNWMLNECRRTSLKSIATQTPFFVLPSISIEESITCRKIPMYEEDYEKDSIKSFSSRDSGVPVSRNQSFASNESRSHQNALLKQKAFDMQFPDPVTSCSYAEFSNTTKDFSSCEFSDSERENSQKYFIAEKEKPSPSNGFIKAVGLSFPFMNGSNNQTQTNFNDKPRELSTESNTLSLRSDSPIPQNDTLTEENVKTKKTFSFSFFSRSKKYSLPKTSLKDNHSSTNIQHLKEGSTPASARNGMTSIDVKRFRKQTQLSNSLLPSDNTSLSSGDKDPSETASALEVYENDINAHCISISRSFSTTEKCKAESDDLQRNLSKSTSDLTVVIPPPPPPPPPFLPNSSQIMLRPKSQNTLGLPPTKGVRTSWSGNPTIKEYEETEERPYNTLPKPKSKMKTLNWAKIPSAHVSGEFKILLNLY